MPMGATNCGGLCTVAGVDALKAAIVDVPDFPRPGILFRDLSPVLADPALFAHALERMASLVDWANVDLIVGIESRGFIVGAALAAKHGKGFALMRKGRRLPPPVMGHAYKQESGDATLELRGGSGRVLLVDDTLATGETLEAAMALCHRAGYDVVDVRVLMNLTMLNTVQFAGQRVRAAVTY